KSYQNTDGVLAFYGHAPERIYGVQKTRVLHHHQRTVTRREETATDRDPFVFFAYLHHFEVRITHDGLEQMVARDAIGQGDDEMNTRFLDLLDDIFGLELRVCHLSSGLGSVQISVFKVQGSIVQRLDPHSETLNLEPLNVERHRAPARRALRHFFYKIRQPLADHDRCQIRICMTHHWHNRRVPHPQIRHAMHAQFFI